jgi:hypothetical protein
MHCFVGALVVFGGPMEVGYATLEYLNGTDWVEYPFDYDYAHIAVAVLPCP